MSSVSSVLAPADPESDTLSESLCRDAQNWAPFLGLNTGRSPMAYSWNGLPYQCAAQVGNDDALHFNTNSGTDNSRFTNGEFVMICETGIQIVGVGCLF